MTEKEEIVLNTITDYWKKNKNMPSLVFMQRELKYKSKNSIRQIMLQLEKKNYLKRNINNRLIINDNTIIDSNLIIIDVINTNEKIGSFLDKRKKYVAFKIKNNCFQREHILKDDILIINKNKKIKNNDIGLFIIDNKYRVMKYNYQDGFYILKDKEEIILNNIKIIGKVIKIERKL